MTRTLLFVPGDSERKFERACASDTDALILDLEDSVAPDQKGRARELTCQHIARVPESKQVWVRINALDTPHALEDLARVVPHRPFGIVLPKCSGAADLLRAAYYLDALEASAAIAHGSVRILAIVTETADAIFKAG